MLAFAAAFAVQVRAVAAEVMPGATSTAGDWYGFTEQTAVTGISELSDVAVRDWAYRTLQQIAQRPEVELGAIFAGDRPLSRDEFAARLSAVLQRLTERLTSETPVLSNPDLLALERLQVEFAPQLEALRLKLNGLEARTPTLAEKQFSTTTKLSGQAIVALNGIGPGERADGRGRPIANDLVLRSRVRLTFDTSFTRRDRLRLRIQAGDIPNFGSTARTDMARLGIGGDTNRRFNVSRLEYRFPLGRDSRFYIEATGSSLNDFTDAVNYEIGSSSEGSISRFGQRNPIYRLVSGTGAGITYDLTRTINFSVGFLVDLGSVAEDDDPSDAEPPSRDTPYAVLTQLTFEPSRGTGVGLTYIHTFNGLDTGTGSELANDPFNGRSRRVYADSYGLQATFRLAPGFSLGGWFGQTEAHATDLPGGPSASIINYALTLAFPDLGGVGNLGGIVVGQPPKATANSLGAGFRDADTAHHLEVFYRLRIADNISITPGVLVVFNPEHNRNNTPIEVGTVRTTFNF